MIALAALCAGIIAVLAVGFFVPAAADQYAREAIAVNISSFSVESFTERGVATRVQGTLGIDAQHVHGYFVRTIGRFGSWALREVDTGNFTVFVSLIDYHNDLLGTARIPAMTIDVRNGRKTKVDFLAELNPGSLNTIRILIDDYIQGNLCAVRLQAAASLDLKSRFFILRSQQISQKVTFKGAPLSLPLLQKPM